MDEIRTIPPILTRKEWNALLDHGLDKNVTHILRERDGKWEILDGSTGMMVGTPNASLTTQIEYTIAQGSKHIYVKGTGIWVPTNNNISPNVIIEGEDRFNFKIHAVDVDNDKLLVGHGTTLINVSVKDAGGLIQPLGGPGPPMPPSPQPPYENIDRPIGLFYNCRQASPTFIGNWYQQAIGIECSEDGRDGPGFYSKTYGYGDAVYCETHGLGQALSVVNTNPITRELLNGRGIDLHLRGQGFGFWGRAEEGATTSGYPFPVLVCLTTLIDACCFYIDTTGQDTTTDIFFGTNAKTAGQIMHFYQSVSDFAGVGIKFEFKTFRGTGMLFDFAAEDGEAPFSAGKFLDFKSQGLSKFSIDYFGHVDILSKAETEAHVINIWSDAVADATVVGLYMNFGAEVPPNPPGSFAGSFIVANVNDEQRFKVTYDGDIITQRSLQILNADVSAQDAIYASMAEGFSGKFASLMINNVEKFSVTSLGDIIGMRSLQILNDVLADQTAIYANMKTGFTAKLVSLTVNEVEKFAVTNVGDVIARRSLQILNDVLASQIAIYADMKTGYTAKFMSLCINGDEKFGLAADGSIDTHGHVAATGYVYSAAYVQGEDFKSGDGTVGLTADIQPQGSTTVLHFKDGLYVGYD